jgi:nitrogenase-stabilizing/protective protein
MILDTLARLSAAEQFFDTLGVPYDPHVLNVSRLHILKRFKDLLRSADIEGLDDDSVTAVCRAALIEAHDECAEGRASKTFKVFQERARPAFVPLGEIRRAV